MIPLIRKCSKAAINLRGRTAGFTLLEVLLAIFFFSIIITTLFGAYTAVFDQAASVEDSLASSEMAQTCLKRILIDLQSIYVTLPPIYKRPTLEGDPDPYRIVSAPSETGGDRFMSLRFTSMAHVVLDRQVRSGVAEIVYYIQAREDDQFNLHRSDRLFFEEAFEPRPDAPILCEQVKRLTFKFIDHEGEEQDTWDSESEDFDHATPRAIIILLEIGNLDKSFAYEARINLPVSREKVGAI
jgi:general secretion pathway protein J